MRKRTPRPGVRAGRVRAATPFSLTLGARPLPTASNHSSAWRVLNMHGRVGCEWGSVPREGADNYKCALGGPRRVKGRAGKEVRTGVSSLGWQCLRGAPFFALLPALRRGVLAREVVGGPPRPDAGCSGGRPRPRGKLSFGPGVFIGSPKVLGRRRARHVPNRRVVLRPCTNLEVINTGVGPQTLGGP